MKISRILSFALMLVIQASAVTVFAQQAGDIITGVVSDNDGPMMMVNVTERDQDDRIVAHAITDMDGVFAFKLVNPKDRLNITYVGYETVDIPFDKLHFDIKMKVNKGKLIGTKEVYPRDRGMVGTNTDYMEKLKQYAPENFVCGYIMRNAWNKNLWGIFIVKDGDNYNLVYKEADKTETRSIISDLAKELEASVNKKIADIEYAVKNPTVVEVYEGGFPEVDIIYDGDIAFAVTPDKAAHFWAWSMKDYLGINDDIWQQEIEEFKTTLKAGDVFTGTVMGRFGPLAGANIREFGDDDYFNIEVADSLGRFSMQINNPEHKFSVLSFPYEVLEITPTGSPMEIKLETVRRSGSGKMVPADGAGGNFIKADNNYVLRQPVIPKEFICGYAVQPINFSEQRSWYGVFLHKDDKGYMVVLHYCGGGCADTIRIDDKLAERLSGSVELAIDRAPSEQFQEDNGVVVVHLHEGSNVYAVMPGKTAVIWREEIPDRVWNRLYHQFGKNLGYKQVESKWIGSYDYPDGTHITYPRFYDDGRALTSYVNRLRYRYDVETDQAVVERSGSLPSGDLVIESGITVERKVWPVTAIEAGALENCTGVSSVSIPESVTSIGELAFRFCDLDSVKLSSVNPIACPVNAFDESVYENAVLIVPKGWKQKKAAKIGPAWGKFKNIKQI